MYKLSTNFAYSSSQWGETFNSKFPIKKSVLATGEGYYHYTSMANALNILSKGKKDIVLYASHFLFLNDGEELLNGLGMVLKELQKKTKIGENDSKEMLKGKKRLQGHLVDIEAIKPNQIHNAPNHFIICFCKEGNLLTQWEYYGKECGIAIEFDLENCEYGGFVKNTRNKKADGEYVYIPPRDIIYKDSSKKKIIEKINEKDNYDEISTTLLPLKNVAAASFMKHNAFQNEKEVRLLFSPIYYLGCTAFDLSKELVDFRESNGVLKPYIKVHIKHKDNNQLPIKSVTVGPGQNQHLVYNAILKLVQLNYGANDSILSKPQKCIKYNYEYVSIGKIEVRRSTIPFRG